MGRNIIYIQTKRLLYLKYKKQMLKRFAVQRKNQVDRMYTVNIIYYQIAIEIKACIS